MRTLFPGLLCILLLPVSGAYASLGDEVNALLDFFFDVNGAQAPLVPGTTQPELDIPPLALPQTPTPEDISGFRAQIMQEESELEKYEYLLRDYEQNLQTLQSEKADALAQIILLDSRISVLNTNLKNLTRQQDAWQERLNALTREKAFVQADMRHQQREYADMMNKNIIRSEHFSSGTQSSLVKWLFSENTVAQILEQRRVTDWLSQRKKNEIDATAQEKKNLESRERQAALLLGQISGLRQQAEQQTQVLSALVAEKETLESTLDSRESQLLGEIDSLRYSQAEATVMIDNLRQGLQEMSERTDDLPPEQAQQILELSREVTPEEPPAAQTAAFRFPLDIAPVVTADFHDPDYEAALGRVHEAMDFYAPQGTPVYAAAAGTVKKVESNGFGYAYIVIQHDRNTSTVYGHLSKMYPEKGDIVQQGEQIALSGGTPGTAGAGYFTTGPHLEFQVFRNGDFIDPRVILPNLPNKH